MPSNSSAFSDSARPDSPPSLWRNSSFRSLWAGQTASQLGEQSGFIILPLIAVLTLDVDPGQLGALRAVEQAPQLLLTLFAGVWVDRWQTRTVMALSDLGRALIFSAVAACALAGLLRLPMLLACALTVGVLSVLFNTAYQVSLVRLLKRDQLLHGNSAIEASRSASQMTGPALGGALASLLSAPLAIVSSALFFSASFLAIAHIRHRETIPQHPSGPRKMRQNMREGIRFVTGNKILRTVSLASAAFQLSLAATTTAYLLFLPRELHLSAAVIGLALAATGPGALLGALLAARLPSRLGYGPVLIAAAVVGNGIMLCLSALHGNSLTTICALIAINFTFGACGQLINVSIIAVRQAVTPGFLQGRVAATISFAGMGMSPLGALLGGLLADHHGLRAALLISASGLLMSPILMILSPLRRLGRIVPRPDPTYEQAH
ncbi:MFS transporter [Dactylosporangium sp. NPDC000555]|uniref:MFS transporter n=1 Tax=Dactylosporangium sp. NPDC000555 TaxID=3154260 RepID=UPI0033243058